MVDASGNATRTGARDHIVRAAARVLADNGMSGLTTRAVAEAAGVQAPAIYRLFGDKDGLLDAVAEHVMATYVAAKAGAVSEAARSAGDPVEDLRAGWRSHIEFGLVNPDLFVLLHAGGRRAPSPAVLAGLDVLRTRVGRLAGAGLLRVGEARALDMIHAAGTGTVLALLQQQPPGHDTALADAMFEAIASAVLSSRPLLQDPGPEAAAVTLAAHVPRLPRLSDAERALLAEWLDRSGQGPGGGD